MIPFVAFVSQPRKERRIVPVVSLPFVVGRSPDASFSLEGPGIWDRHLTVEFDPPDSLVARVQEGALASADGEAFERLRIRPGVGMVVGDATLSFHLAPVKRRSLRAWGVFVLLLGLAVGLVEGYAVWRLAQ